jgi:SAM-dependent methyltransferase
MTVMSLAKKIWGFTKRPLRRGPFYYGEFRPAGVGTPVSDRWKDIGQIGDFRAADHVLDMGCAEGLISLLVAKQVARVHGVELSAERVKQAQLEAVRQNIHNISFAAGSVTDYPVEPNSYDVVLFLGVLNKKTDTGYVGTKELERLLRATRRQIIIRANIQSYEKQITRLIDILEKMDEQGFDAICFSRRLGQGNMIIGNRRGTDAKLGTVPPLVLVPTEHLREHPCLRGARIGTIKDFA